MSIENVVFNAEEKDKRRHEEALAETKRRDNVDKREHRGYFFIGLAVFAILFSLIGSLYLYNVQDNANQAKIKIEHEKTAKACIDRNYIWINDGCIPLTSTR